MVVQSLVVPGSTRRVGHVIESAGSRKQTKILDHDVISDSRAIGLPANSSSDSNIQLTDQRCIGHDHHGKRAFISNSYSTILSHFADSVQVLHYGPKTISLS